jgi:hypothetical protein
VDMAATSALISFLYTFINNQNIIFYKLICSYTRYDVAIHLAWSGGHPVALPFIIHFTRLLARPSDLLARPSDLLARPSDLLAGPSDL